MLRERDDYILRLVEESGGVLQKLLQKIGIGETSPEEIVQEAQKAQETLLGPLAKVIPLVDANTAVSLINNPKKVELLIDLLRVEADAAMKGGWEDTAQKLEAKIEALQQAIGGNGKNQ